MSGRWMSKPPAGTQIDWTHPLAQGLVGCWLFNECAGVRANNLAAFQHGTLTSGAAFVPGGVQFDGTDDHVQTTLAINNSSGLSFSVWINLTSAGNYPIVISYGVNADTVPELRGQSTSGKIEIVNRNTNSGALDPTAILGTGWHHYVATCSKSTFCLYRNGKTVSTASVSHSIAGSVAVRFGRRSNDEFGSLCLTGRLDRPMIYNRLLSPAEASWLYTAPYAFLAPSPVMRSWFVLSSVVAQQQSLSMFGVGC